MKIIPRPCTCDEFAPGKEWAEPYCRLCWLYHHDPHYNLKFGGKGLTKPYHGAPPPGAGTLLHRRLEWFGVAASDECNCKDHVLKMDRWGPDKCREELETIVAWMGESAKARNWPFSPLLARKFALAAIDEATRLRSRK